MPVLPTPPTTAVHIRRALHGHAQRHGDRPAVIDTATVLTFAELWRRAHADELRLRPGTIAAIPAASTAAFLVEVAATWLCGAVPMPLDPRTPRPLRAAMVRLAAAGSHTCQPWKAVLSVAGGVYRPLLTGGEPPTAARKAHAVGLGPADPPGARTPGRVALFASPMWLNGPFEFAVRHLLLGGTVAMLQRFDPHRWAAHAAAVQPGWLFLAPIQIARLLDHVPERSLRFALAGVQTLVHSAAPCPPALRRRLLDQLDAHVVAEYYGAAEYDGTLARADETAPGAAPIAGALLRVVDPAGRPAGPGVAGIVEGRSSVGLVSHYAGQPCPAAHGWRTVGDHGLLDHAGRLTVTSVDSTGRAIVGGVNVALSRVRAVVASHPAVLGCQVIAIPDDTYGQVLTIRVTTDRQLDPGTLHEHCVTHLRPAERPRHIHITSPDRPPQEADHARM